jgi:hypothetical protein
MPIAHRSTPQSPESHPLNVRQRVCLQVIAELDRENERRFGQKRNRAEKGEPPPPEAWRWLQHDPPHTVSEPELKRRLRQVGIGGGGIKATMKALWMRAHPVDERLYSHPQRAARPLHCVQCRLNRVLSVQLTEIGRKLARTSPARRRAKNESNEGHDTDRNRPDGPARDRIPTAAAHRRPSAIPDGAAL